VINNLGVAMRKLIFGLILLIFCCGFNIQDEPKEVKINWSNIAAVKSNLEITGIVTFDRPPKPIPGREIRNSAIINDMICWQGETYTIIEKTGRLLIRTVDERRKKAPYLKIVRISRGKVLMEFGHLVDKKIRKYLFEKTIKKHNKS